MDREIFENLPEETLLAMTHVEGGQSYDIRYRWEIVSFDFDDYVSVGNGNYPIRALRVATPEDVEQVKKFETEVYQNRIEKLNKYKQVLENGKSNSYLLHK